MALRYGAGFGPMIESSGIFGSPIASTTSSKCLGVGRSACSGPETADMGHHCFTTCFALSMEYAQQTLTDPKQGFSDPPLFLKAFTISSPEEILINPSAISAAVSAESAPEAAM